MEWERKSLNYYKTMTKVKTIELDSILDRSFVYLIIIRYSHCEHTFERTHSVWNTFDKAEVMKNKLLPHMATTSEIMILELPMSMPPSEGENPSDFRDWREVKNAQSIGEPQIAYGLMSNMSGSFNWDLLNRVD